MNHGNTVDVIPNMITRQFYVFVWSLVFALLWWYLEYSVLIWKFYQLHYILQVTPGCQNWNTDSFIVFFYNYCSRSTKARTQLKKRDQRAKADSLVKEVPKSQGKRCCQIADKLTAKYDTVSQYGTYAKYKRCALKTLWQFRYVNRQLPYNYQLPSLVSPSQGRT